MSVSITGDDSDANAVPTGALRPARGLQGKSRHGMKAVSAAKAGNLGQLKMKVSGRLIVGGITQHQFKCAPLVQSLDPIKTVAYIRIN
jgi:hypothetical protein